MRLLVPFHHVAALAASHNTSSSSAEVSLIVGAVGLAAALTAVGFAYYQTRQLKAQIVKLEHTELALTDTQGRITAFSTELYRLLEISNSASESPELLDGLRQLAANCGAVFQRQTTYLNAHLQEQLDVLIQQSRQATTHQLQVKATTDVAAMALSLVKLARPNEEVFTTSYVSTDAYWNDPSAKRYLEVNRELIEDAGVKITRIFIFDNPESEAKSREQMDRQCAAGIHVRTAFAGDLEPDLKRDMFLLSNRLAAENEMTADRNDILSVRIWDGESPEIDEFAHRMKALMRSSREYAPFGPGAADEQE